LEEAHGQIVSAGQLLRHVALGGTAAGTGTNTPSGFRQLAVNYLANLSGANIEVAKDGRYGLQSHFPLLAFSSALRNFALELIRLANDLRLLASGPITGLGEIVLPAVQPGSSIMPGKVNPSVPEMINQLAFDVVGADATVALAAQAGQLELNVMTPVVTFRLLHSVDILSNALEVFAKKCVEGIEANRDRCHDYFSQSPSLVTVLTPKIGYAKAAEIFKESLATKKPVLDIAKARGMITESDIKALLDLKALTGEDN